MQEKGIEAVYKKLGLNADTIHVATAHEIGHCWSSYFLQTKQFDQFSGKKYKVSSVKEAEQKERSKAYRVHLERFGDIFATVYARRYQGNMQFLKVFRQIDNDQLYDTKKGIVLAENSHLNHLTIAEESAMILDQVY